MPRLEFDSVSEPLQGLRLGGPFIYRSRTGSTNDDARAMAETAADEGTVVIAGEQTRGRGRKSRAWFGDPDRSLQLSVILRPALPSEHFPRLVNTVGVAVAEGCAAAAGCRVGTKWPNDLIVGGRKLGGILLEASAPDFAIAGIGLNVLGDASHLPPELRASATSLAVSSVAPLTREAVLVAVLRALNEWYEVLLQGQWDAIITRQRELETTLNHEHALLVGAQTITGYVEGLSPDGGLVLQTPRGRRTITVGEVL